MHSPWQRRFNVLILTGLLLLGSVAGFVGRSLLPDIWPLAEPMTRATAPAPSAAPHSPTAFDEGPVRTLVERGDKDAARKLLTQASGASDPHVRQSAERLSAYLSFLTTCEDEMRKSEKALQEIDTEPVYVITGKLNDLANMIQSRMSQEGPTFSTAALSLQMRTREFAAKANGVGLLQSAIQQGNYTKPSVRRKQLEELRPRCEPYPKLKARLEEGIRALGKVDANLYQSPYELRDMAVTEDDKCLIALSREGVLLAFTGEKGNPVAERSLDVKAKGLAVLGQTAFVCDASRKQLRRFALPSLIEGPSIPIDYLTCGFPYAAGDETLWFLATSREGLSYAVRVDLDTQRIQPMELKSARIRQHLATADRASLSILGNNVLCVGWGGFLATYDLETGAELPVGMDMPPHDLAFSTDPRGQYLFTNTGKIYACDLQHEVASGIWKSSMPHPTLPVYLVFPFENYTGLSQYGDSLCVIQVFSVATHRPIAQLSMPAGSKVIVGHRRVYAYVAQKRQFVSEPLPDLSQSLPPALMLLNAPRLSSKMRESFTFEPRLANPDPEAVFSLGKSPKGMIADPRTGKVSWNADPASTDPAGLIEWELVVVHGTERVTHRYTLRVIPESIPMETSPGPTHFNVSPDGKFIFLLNESLGELHVYDLALRKRIQVVPVGTCPSEAASTDRLIYVVNRLSDSLTVVQRGTWSVLKTIPLPVRNPTAIRIPPHSRWAYVLGQAGNMQEGNLLRVNLDAPEHPVLMTWLSQKGEAPQSAGRTGSVHFDNGPIEISEDGSRLYHLSDRDGSASVYDIAGSRLAPLNRIQNDRRGASKRLQEEWGRVLIGSQIFSADLKQKLASLPDEGSGCLLPVHDGIILFRSAGKQNRSPSLAVYSGSCLPVGEAALPEIGGEMAGVSVTGEAIYILGASRLFVLPVAYYVSRFEIPKRAPPPAPVRDLSELEEAERKRIDALQVEGCRMLADGNAEEARVRFQQICQRMPFAGFQYELGLCEAKAQRSQEALKWFCTSLDMLQGERLADCYHQIAMIYAAQKDDAGALQALEEGSRQFPNHPKLLGIQGAVYLNSGQDEKALLAWKALLAVSPDRVDIQRLMADVEKQLRIRNRMPCPSCKGTKILKTVREEGGKPLIEEIPCPQCAHTGFVIRRLCSVCQGSGVQKSERPVMVEGVTIQRTETVSCPACHGERQVFEPAPE